MNAIIKNSLQYISDLHIDRLPISKIVNFKPIAKNLLICGDVGFVKHPNFSEFFKLIKSDYDNVFFVAGNHEFDCSSLFNEKKYNLYFPLLQEIMDKHSIKLLNCNNYNIDSNTIIAGCTLWSNPKMCNNPNKYIDYNNHLIRHCEEVNWIKKILKTNNKIIFASHFVPTAKLIEKKYYKNNEPCDWFYSDLEYLINKPIIGWFCGHSHSKINVNINNVFCGLNVSNDSEIFLY